MAHRVICLSCAKAFGVGVNLSIGIGLGPPIGIQKDPL